MYHYRSPPANNIDSFDHYDQYDQYYPSNQPTLIDSPSPTYASLNPSRMSSVTSTSTTSVAQRTSTWQDKLQGSQSHFSSSSLRFAHESSVLLKSTFSLLKHPSFTLTPRVLSTSRNPSLTKPPPQSTANPAASPSPPTTSSPTVAANAQPGPAPSASAARTCPRATGMTGSMSTLRRKMLLRRPCRSYKERVEEAGRVQVIGGGFLGGDDEISIGKRK